MNWPYCKKCGAKLYTGETHYIAPDGGCDGSFEKRYGCVAHEVVWDQTYDYAKGAQQALNNPSSPPHYKQGDIEPMDFYKANPHIGKGFCAGNVIKYVYRYNLKDGLSDLKKAQVYLGWLVEMVEKEQG